MESINERVSSLIKATGLSTNAFAKKLGKPQSSVAVIADGRSKPGFELLELICSTYPDVSRDWLLMGEGEMFRKPEKSADPNPSDYLNEHLKLLEDNFARLAAQLESKDQQIADLQESRRSLQDMLKMVLGKSKGVTFTQLPRGDAKDFNKKYDNYRDAAIEHISSMLGVPMKQQQLNT